MQGRNSNRPNVIVFFTDQQRWDTSGLHGNPLELTPNFDRMAQRGTHVRRSFTCQPVCGPARSCLQTGLYATTSGCFRNGIPLPTHLETLAHQVGRGVRTGRWKYGVDAPHKDGRRDPDSSRYVEQYLYDLQADPHELCNLSGNDSHREVAEDMKARLVRRMVAAGEAAPEIDAAPA